MRSELEYLYKVEDRLDRTRGELATANGHAGQGVLALRALRSEMLAWLQTHDRSLGQVSVSRDTREALIACGLLPKTYETHPVRFTERGTVQCGHFVLLEPHQLGKES